MIRVLSVVDAYTRECLALEVDTTLLPHGKIIVCSRLLRNSFPTSVAELGFFYLISDGRFL